MDGDPRSLSKQSEAPTVGVLSLNSHPDFRYEMSDVRSIPRVVAVVATCNRHAMLATRSLPSIRAQTKSPDVVVVVDDSIPALRRANAALVRSHKGSDSEIVYLENERTPGASGTWNTALDYLANTEEDHRAVFVAVLDDDDSWSPEYLERCIASSVTHELDMVATGLHRFESNQKTPLSIEAPDTLLSRDFLTTNPGIQGSNLFVRLSVVLAAGGFDEMLRSSTDRDLCIRITELGNVRYGKIAAPLVNHYAESDRTRLSTRSSEAKLEGIEAFWQKYKGRMALDERRAFEDRARSLFGWVRSDPKTHPSDSERVLKKALILGLVVDCDTDTLFNITNWLCQWRDRSLVGLDVVFLGTTGSDVAAAIEAASEQLRSSGAGCFIVSRKHSPRQTGDNNMASIYAHCARVAMTRIGAEVWVAEASSKQGHAPTGNQTTDFLRWLNAAFIQSQNLTTASDTYPAEHTSFDHWIRHERIKTAIHRVSRLTQNKRLRLLGCGSEAVVLTDEQSVYKCIDYWKTRMPSFQIDFLRTQVGQWIDTPGLYPLRDVVVDGCWIVLIYDYEDSTPYEGGREEELVRFLVGCCRVNVVCNNIHPKNLVITRSGVKLIDYGSDIRPWTSLGFEHMVQRAFLSCRYHAHPELPVIMRQAMAGEKIPEMENYALFRRRVARATSQIEYHRTSALGFSRATTTPIRLYVGVVTSEPGTVITLLRGLRHLQDSPGIERLAVVLLDNSCPQFELNEVLQEVRRQGLEVIAIDEARQSRDAAAGGFGSALPSRRTGPVSIAAARTMLQRYLGTILEADSTAFGWLLDDDMCVDSRASDYLSWLPKFRDQGVDVLIGSYEGASPNPPINGMRVNLVDLLHNLHWLQRLPRNSVLPDRSAENRVIRSKYTDYYYDLSRKHTAHLEYPHWLEPIFPGETVREAQSRLVRASRNLMHGASITRPVLGPHVHDPTQFAKVSVNRGGTTFILNHRALSETPNLITSFDGREARRSDMVWAIINRYYRNLNIRSVPFPIQHRVRSNQSTAFDLDKARAEIMGSTLYAGLTDFLGEYPLHALDFTQDDIDVAHALANHHLNRRWLALRMSFHRIQGLTRAIQEIAPPGDLDDLLEQLKMWFTWETFDQLRCGLTQHDACEVTRFLTSLRACADNYAQSSIPAKELHAELQI